VDVIEVVAGTERFDTVLSLADEVLDQRRYVVSTISLRPYANRRPRGRRVQPDRLPLSGPCASMSGWGRWS
jgi:hypothetical protein